MILDQNSRRKVNDPVSLQVEGEINVLNIKKEQNKIIGFVEFYESKCVE